ncbi:MAG: pyridoxal phosphate-dependent aminotransferase family protein [Bacteroidia bacterium]|nr:pyridoxal phosphate-dependent aminotransferase family protein [Bacteroidia bacterium]MDW8015796.1 pyridoxal phosphate-dependent aminotransferase family protein [Bacteroidia bacterium]
MELEKRLRQRLHTLPERPFWSRPAEKPDFTTNDYLGLIHDGIIHRILSEAPREWLRGSGASRYLGGDAFPFHEVERLAEVLWGRPHEKALFFPSGLIANLTFWATVPQRGDTILFDREVHASIRYGIRLSGATAWGFPHNDWDAAEVRLRRAKGVTFLVIESLYSMRGTSPDVEALLSLQSRYDFHLIVDEAHTTFILSQGRSWSETVGLNPLARLLTFGKAVGLVGAVWIGPDWLVAYLQRKGFGGIYTTALPPFLGWAIKEILTHPLEWEPRRVKLWHLIHQVRETLEKAQRPYQGLVGPIALLPVGQQPLPLKKLHPPTVPSPAYRMSLHAYNTLREVCELLGL